MLWYVRRSSSRVDMVVMIRAARGCVSLRLCIWWVGERGHGGARTGFNFVQEGEQGVSR